MRKVFTTVILSLAVFAVWSLEAYAGTIINRPLYLGLTQGLVGYWSFDGQDMSGATTALDRSPGNANNGTLTNGPVRTIGKLGQVLDFDGTNDYVDVETNANFQFGTGDFSISAWVKTDTVSGYHIAVGKDDNISGKREWVLGFGGTVAEKFQFLTIDDATTIAVTSDQSILAGQWYHLVAVRTGGVATLYVNTVQDGSDTTAGLNLNLDNAIYIGARVSGGGTQFWDGLIDDVRIYNRALSPDEIRRLYQMGK